MTGRLYEGLKVLDFSTNIAGPIAASMLADFGAEVIKVERPVCGEDTRMAAPPAGRIFLLFLVSEPGQEIHHLKS